MFSSNQVFDILCSENQLKPCLDFAIGMAGCREMLTRQDGRVRLAFAMPAPGIYAIGRGSMEKSSWCGGHACGRGWTDFQFDHDTDILSRVIWQWAMKQDPGPRPDTDGSVEKGVRAMSLCSALDRDIMPEYSSIIGTWSPHEAILIFAPGWLRYDK